MMSQTTDDIDDYGFTDVTVTDAGDDRYDVSVRYTGSGNVTLHYGPVLSTCFGDVGNLNTHIVRTDLEKTMSMTSTAVAVTVESIELPDGKPWYIYFTADDTSSERGLVTANITESQVSAFAVSTNFSTVLLPVIAFYIILFVMFIFNRKMDKVRTELEEEGRLYPKGMGRCKECGMVVLPGETVCRKCGAVIDVPEEYRRKPAPQPAAQTHFECSECGATVPADSKVCPKCGATFDDSDDE